MAQPQEAAISTLTVPNAFRLPTEYEKFGVKGVFEAWGISYVPTNNTHITLSLPADWDVERADEHFFVFDSNGASRMRGWDKMVIIELPVQVKMTSDHDPASTISWVEVSHRNKAVFRSTSFELELSDEEDGIIGDEGDSERADDDPDAYAEFYEQAEKYVRENYPLLNQDPNAYW